MELIDAVRETYKHLMKRIEDGTELPEQALMVSSPDLSTEQLSKLDWSLARLVGANLSEGQFLFEFPEKEK